jgi:hypothetical protein
LLEAISLYSHSHYKHCACDTYLLIIEGPSPQLSPLEDDVDQAEHKENKQPPNKGTTSRRLSTRSPAPKNKLIEGTTKQVQYTTL